MVHVEFTKLNADIEEGSCAIRLYRTKDKEIFTKLQDAYQYLYEKEREQNPTTPKIIRKISTLQKQLPQE